MVIAGKKDSVLKAICTSLKILKRARLPKIVHTRQILLWKKVVEFVVHI